MLSLLVLSTSILLTQACEDGSLRLVDGYSELEGRVEVCQSGWSMLCSTTIHDEATRICTKLGFSQFGATYGEYSNEISNPEGMSYTIDCSASIDCTFNENSVRCKQSFIRCQPLRCEHFDVQLATGEVCINEVWRAILPSSNASAVICRQLGFSSYGATSNSVSSRNTDAVEIFCRAGLENHISKCLITNSTENSNRVTSMITCTQKCGLCRDLSDSIQVTRTSGSSKLAVSWDFRNISFTSLQSYMVTCTSAASATLSASKVVSTAISSVELGDFDYSQGNSGNLSQMVCCVTAQQENHSNYVACSHPNTVLPVTIIIGGASAAAAVVLAGVSAGVILAVVCYVKKREGMNRLKQKRQKEVCASLNDFFSRSTASITPSLGGGGGGGGGADTKKASRYMATSYSEAAKENSTSVLPPDLALDLDIVPCVAYDTPTSSKAEKKLALPEYEDIPI